MTYITIPVDEFKGLGLNPVEKMILAIYKYYCEKGKCKCCKMTNEAISEELEVSLATVVRTKRALKEMNLIRTDGGIKVYYLGTNKVKMTHPVSQNDSKVSQNDSQVSQNDFKVSQNDFVQSQNDTHNKEIKRIKNNKKNKEQMTNFERVLRLLPDTYKEEEKINYIKEIGYYDKINNIPEDELIESVIADNIKGILSFKYSSNTMLSKTINEPKSNDHNKEFDFTDML